MGKEKAKSYKVTLPTGKEATLHNGDRGFFIRHVHKFRCQEGFTYRLRPIKLQEGLQVRFCRSAPPQPRALKPTVPQVGKRGMNSFPGSMDVSKHHVTVACVNNFYFIKDTGTKKGSYIKIGSGKNKRIELHKGMTFAVGKLQMKVSNIEGDAADNRKIKEKMDAERREKEEAAAAAGKDAKPEVELDEDEEFADDSDEDDGGKGGKKGKLDGPPVMFLSAVDKKVQVRGRIRETSTIGTGSDNKIVVKEDIAKPRSVDAVHTRIVLEDGHFYLENESKGIGTYVGLPKKTFFEINHGDQLLLGSARVSVEYLPGVFSLLDGLIDKILGKQIVKVHDMKLCGTAGIELRLKASKKEEA